MAWAFGEVALTSSVCSLSDAQQRLMLLLEQHSQHKQLSLNILCSLFKLTMLSKQPLKDDRQLLSQLFDRAPNLLIKQRLRELLNLNKVLSTGQCNVPAMTDFREDRNQGGRQHCHSWTAMFLKPSRMVQCHTGQEHFHWCHSKMYRWHLPRQSSQNLEPVLLGIQQPILTFCLPNIIPSLQKLCQIKSPVKQQPWSALGRKKEVRDVHAEMPSTALESTSKNPKEEDAELIEVFIHLHSISNGISPQCRCSL
uniref:Uncharacterized protein n=1 Tax=Ixodes ricinus TaxID=34613 RepID=V5GYD4_IXORI